MLERRFLVCLVLFFLATCAPAAADGPFRDLAPEAARTLPARDGSREAPLPGRFRALEVDVKALETLLDRAPAERSAAGVVAPLLLALPYPDGTDKLF